MSRCGVGQLCDHQVERTRERADFVGPSGHRRCRQRNQLSAVANVGDMIGQAYQRCADAVGEQKSAAQPSQQRQGNACGDEGHSLRCSGRRAPSGLLVDTLHGTLQVGEDTEIAAFDARQLLCAAREFGAGVQSLTLAREHAVRSERCCLQCAKALLDRRQLDLAFRIAQASGKPPHDQIRRLEGAFRLRLAGGECGAIRLRDQQLDRVIDLIDLVHQFVCTQHDGIDSGQDLGQQVAELLERGVPGLHLNLSLVLGSADPAVGAKDQRLEGGTDVVAASPRNHQRAGVYAAEAARSRPIGGDHGRRASV